MRGGGVVVRRRRPLSESQRQFESFNSWTRRSRKLIARLMKRDVAQPDDVFFVFGKLGVVVVIRGPNRMGLEMSMDSRMRVVSVGLVDMLRRNDRMDRNVRRQGQDDDWPTQETRHTRTIIARNNPGSNEITRFVQPARYFHVTSMPKKCMKTSRLGRFFGFCCGLRI